jgi:hypothetical protein
MGTTQPLPIKIDLGFSVWMASYLLCVHLLTLALLFLLDLGIYFSFCLIALVIYSLIYNWRRYLQQNQANSVIGVDWNYDRAWLVRLNDGNSFKAELLPTSLVSRWLVILHFNTDIAGKQRVVVLGDAIDSDLLRKLKVLLKMYNHFGV